MTKFTPGTLRAAREALRYIDPTRDWEWTAPEIDADVQAIAQIIDAETASAELLEALEDLVSLAAAAMSEANCDGAEYHIDAELKSARAAIAKATEPL